MNVCKFESTYIRECFVDCHRHIRKGKSHWDQQYHIQKLLSSAIMHIKVCISIMTNILYGNNQHRIDVQYIFSSPCFANHFGDFKREKRNATMVVFFVSSCFFALTLHNILVGTLYEPPSLIRKCFTQVCQFRD